MTVSVVLGRPSSFRSKGLAWFRQAFRPSHQDIVWTPWDEQGGRPLLTAGVAGSGMESCVDQWVCQALDQGVGLVAFSSHSKGLEGLWERALTSPQPTDLLLIDATSGQVDPWFEASFQQAVVTRSIVLVRLPEEERCEEQARSVVRALEEWVWAIPPQAMLPGGSLWVLKKGERYFDGLTYQKRCHDLAERRMVSLLSVESLDCLPGHPQACWLDNLLEPVREVILFKQPPLDNERLQRLNDWQRSMRSDEKYKASEVWARVQQQGLYAFQRLSQGQPAVSGKAISPTLSGLLSPAWSQALTEATAAALLAPSLRRQAALEEGLPAGLITSRERF